MGRTALDSIPRLAKAMPCRLPLAPSHTATITPAVNTSSDVNSARVGTLFSTATASTAVATGIPDLRAIDQEVRFILKLPTRYCNMQHLPARR